MKRFTNDIVDIKRGDTDINKVYRGENLVWERTTPEIIAEGGTETTITVDGENYRVHTFTQSGTFTVFNGGEMEYLIVAGGGGGGAGKSDSTSGGGGGGGGAGGVITNLGAPALIAAGIYGIEIGQKGLGGTPGSNAANATGKDGENTTALGLTAIGGGGGGAGGGIVGALTAGRTGGSGGGGASSTSNSFSSGGTGTTNQGNNGGTPVGCASGLRIGGGGGGSDTAGQNGTCGNAGNGGDGLLINIDNNNTRFGAGGGGGVEQNGTAGSGGAGGGGNGGQSITGTSIPGDDATGFGNGGGGCGKPFNTTPAKGGDGSDGIVIIRYKITKYALQFDGVTGRVDLGPTPDSGVVNGNDSFTLITKFKFTSDERGHIYSFFGSADITLVVNRVDEAPNAVTLSIFAGSATGTIRVASGTLQKNTIYTVGAVRDKVNGMRLFVNGVLVASNTSTINASTSGLRTDSIGADITFRHTNGRRFFEGTIYDVKIYNQVLTDSEVADVSSGQIISKTPTAHWDFQDGQGTTLTDIIGDGTNNGTLLGGVTWVEV